MNILTNIRKETEEVLREAKQIAVGEIQQEAIVNEIASTIKFAKHKKDDLLLGIDMISSSVEAMTDFDPSKLQTVSRLKNIKSAVEEGLLVDAWIEIGKMNDPIDKECLSADFKEMYQQDLKIQRLTPVLDEKIMQEICALKIISNKGELFFGALSGFSEKDFDEAAKKAIKEIKQIEEIRTSPLPEFEEPAMGTTPQ